MGEWDDFVEATAGAVKSSRWCNGRGAGAIGPASVSRRSVRSIAVRSTGARQATTPPRTRRLEMSWACGVVGRRE